MPKQHLDVFISSTSIDLPEHRKAVVDALLSIGLFPSGMEHWPVTSENPVNLCYQKMQDAELFVGIYAHRYGWRPNGDGTPSITEIEYDWAGQLNIPRFCFIMSEDFSWPVSKIELDALDDLNAFKARVNEQVRGIFTTPDNLKAQILTALAHYAQKQNLTGLNPYLNNLHNTSMQSGLLRALDPRTKDPTFQGRHLTVEQIYVPLDTHSRIQRADNGVIQREDMDHESEEMAREELLSPLTAMEAASAFPKLVILGDPGSGKSTFVNFLALGLTGHLLDPQKGWLDRLSEQGWDQDAILPILITLRDFAQNMGPQENLGTAKSLLRYIYGLLEQCGCDKEISTMQTALTSGNALLILDGLDEVPTNHREMVHHAISGIIAAYPCRILITCRILSYANPEWHISKTKVVTLAPFSNPKIEHFIKAWYTAVQNMENINSDITQKRIADLTNAVENPQLRDMAANPMLMTVMAIVHNHQGTLPLEIARLYNECIELLMLRWHPEDTTSLKDDLNVQESDLYQALWKLAYEAHDRQLGYEGPADLTESDVVFSLRDRLGGLDNAARFCNYVEQRAGLLYGRGVDKHGIRIFTFPHRTFQEYLAACHMTSSSRAFNRLVSEKARLGEKWRQVLILATGQLIFVHHDTERPIDAAEKILAVYPQKEEDWHAVWLAGDILQLVGLQRILLDETGRHVLPVARERLATLISESHLKPVERAVVGRTLSELGDPRIGVLVSKKNTPDLEWGEVPAGPFKMGGDPEAWNAWEGGIYDFPYLFWIAKYPITYAQFAPFVEAGGYTEKSWWTKAGWETKEEGWVWNVKKKEWELTNESWTKPRYWEDPQWHIANHPVVGVSWYEAYAYTQWLNAQNMNRPTGVPSHYVLRLARECEWEKAARYPDGRLFPWGDEWEDGSRVNWKGSGIGRTSAVGVFPEGANPVHGTCDLIGNVWEWCLTVWSDHYLSPDKENNNSEGRLERCARGGSWPSDNIIRIRATARNSWNPGYGNYLQGFRMVWSIPI